MTTFNITLTDAATSYIKKMLTQANGYCFHLSIKKTGCSGYAYAPTILETKQADLLIEEIAGIPFAIDKKWEHLLTGIQIDYIEDTKSGLKQKRLVFINPNEATRCGCGESFHVES